MQYLGVGEAKQKLSKCIAESQKEPVIIMNHGRPTAMLVGLDGVSFDQVAGAQTQVARMLAEAETRPRVPWSEVRAKMMEQDNAGTKRRRRR